MHRRRDRIAKPLLEQQLQAHVGPDLPNELLLAHIVADALLRRLDRNLVESKNIYLEQFGIPQIELFAALTRAVPLVSASHEIANHHLADALRQRTQGSLFEIGIGRGTQVLALIDQLASDRGALRKLRVVALDPDANNLTFSESILPAAAQRAGLELELISYRGLIEDLSPQAWHKLAQELGERPVANAAFTLHHTMHGVNDTDYRTRLLTQMRESIRPAVFTLIEPHAQHDADRVSRRFDECWQHFGAVFELIDRSDVSREERFVIKETFFGREIRDIFGTSDMFRSERHERCERWLFRLTRAGYTPFEASTPVPVRLPDYCSASATEGMVRIGLDELPIVACFAFAGVDHA